jgi:predicted dehydrogenase
MNRKEFVKTAGLAAASLTVLPGSKLFAKTAADTKVKIGIIGVGARGIGHLDLLLNRQDVEVISVCDIDEKRIEAAKKRIAQSGRKMPDFYSADNYAWKTMLEKKQHDGIVIATPWEWHSPMVIGSIEAGVKYVGTEVVLGITLEDHWDVVKAAEKNKAHVMMLEPA